MPLVLGHINRCELGLHILTFGQFANCIVVHKDLDSLLVDTNGSDNLLRLDTKFCGGYADELGKRSLQKVDCAVVVVLGAIARYSRLQVETSH